MGTVATDLAWVQSRLHDGGSIWGSAELLRWWQDGYRQLLSLSQGVRRIRALDMPGRHTYSLTYDWEDRHATGTVSTPFRQAAGGNDRCTALWEIEHLTGAPPSASWLTVVHEWERAYVGVTDQHFTFAFPRNHERILRLVYDDKKLTPVSQRSLDESDTDWVTEPGLPQWWMTGAGRVRTVDIYELDTEVKQGYVLRDSDAGVPREMSGARTYGVNAGERPVANGYAYTTTGDQQALTQATGDSFDPDSAYCYTWEADYGASPSYNFTINLPNASQVTVFPWESGMSSDAASTKRGMYFWEWDLVDRSVLVPGNDAIIVITGPGVYLDTSVYSTLGTASWEKGYGADSITLGLGTIRDVVSPDRQYLVYAVDSTELNQGGTVRDWKSSTDSLLVTEVVVPDSDLATTDTPALIPAQFSKYIRYYVLALAFGRQGEGRNSILATHYMRRFQRGVLVLKKLANIVHRDQSYAREAFEAAPTHAVPRVRLPSTFPRV